MQNGSRRKRQRINGDETDAFGSWRHLVHWQSHERSRIKRGARRRERHQGKQEAQREQQDAKLS